MKMASRMLGAGLLLGAMVFLAGCEGDQAAGKGGTIPPAWDDPGAARVPGGDKAAWSSSDLPSDWGVGGGDGAIDERTGVRRVNAEGFPIVMYFGFDTDRIAASEASKAATAAQFMKAHPELVLVIEGHCDDRGTEEYNRALGERRAIAVENNQRSAGVDLANIRTVSYGEDKPAVTGSGESVWSQNRRAVLWVGKAN